MKKIIKTQEMEKALLNGDQLSPLDAWERWKMAGNTFNRWIWQLRHKKRWKFEEPIKVQSEGSTFKIHRLAVSFIREARCR